jgi:ribonuclease HI
MENTQQSLVTIWTDGACSTNTRCGGWAAILCYGEKKVIISGHEQQTTNNRMELKAVIEGLKRLKRPFPVRIYSDSKYVVNAIKDKWCVNWQKRGWKKSDGNQVLNVDLWEALLAALKNKATQYEFVWVKGHAGNPMNEEVDMWAQTERDMAYKELCLELKS